MSTNLVGAAGEAAVASKLMDMGYVVSEPMSDALYDLVADMESGLVRVQVKVARYSPDDDTYRVGFERTSYGADGCKREVYQEGDFDAYAIYNPDRDEIYWLWFDDAPKWGVSRTVKSWQDHRLSKVLSA